MAVGCVTPRGEMLTLGAADVFAVPGVHADGVAGIDEDRDADFKPIFHRGRLGNVGRRIPADPGGGGNHLEFDDGRQFNLGRLAFHFHQGTDEIAGEKLGVVGKELFGKRDGLVSVGIHEVVAGLILVAEFDLAGHHIDHFNCFGRSKADHRTLAPFQAPDRGLHEGAQIAGGAVLHVEHNADIVVVLDRHSFSHVIRGRHN